MLQAIDLDSQDLAIEFFFEAVEFNRALDTANTNADGHGLTGRWREVYVNRYMLDASTLEDWLAARAAMRSGIATL